MDYYHEQRTKEQGIGPNRTFNANELARLARLCLGSTSTVDFSKRAGLSRSFLSAVLNANLRGQPSRKSLEKMAKPEAQPQNGITAAQLLKAAGYEPDSQPMAADLVTPAKLDSSAFLDEVQRYCAADIEDTCISAQCMVGELIKRDTSPSLTVNMRDGRVIITEEKPDSDSPLYHICIPAFVLDEHLVAYAVSAAVLRLGEIKNEYKGYDARFYILTNNESLCNFLCKAYRAETNLEILLARGLYSVTRVYPPRKNVDEIQQKDAVKE